MLKNEQIEKLEVAETLLLEVIESQEFQKLDIDPDLTLGDSLQGIQEVLKEFYPDDYVPMSPAIENPEEKPQNSQLVRQLKRVRGWRSPVIDIFASTAIISLLSAAVSVGLCVFFWGVSDMDKAAGNKLKPDFAVISLGYRGLAIAGIGLFITCGVSASIIASGEKQ